MLENEKIELYILSKDYMLHYVLPIHAQGSMQLYLEGEKRRDQVISVRAIHQHWCFVVDERVHFHGIAQSYLPVEKKQHYEVDVQQDHYLLLTSLYEVSTHTFQGYHCTVKKWTIGRSTDSDIVYSHHAVSFHHACIYKDEGGWHIKDLMSRNGCFVNGRRVQHAMLHCKDKIQILELKILMGDDEMYINTIKECQFSSALQRYYKPQTAYEADKPAKLSLVYVYNEQMERQIFDIALPPALPEDAQRPLILTLGPSFTMGLSSLSMGLFALFQVYANHGNLIQSIPTLLMSFTMAVGSMLWPLLSRRYEKRKKKELTLQMQERYHTYLEDVRAEILKEIQSYEQSQRSAFLGLDVCFSALLQQQRFILEEEHPAYLHVLLGYATMLYPVQFQVSKKDFLLQKQELMEAYNALVTHRYQVENVALSLSFQTIKLTCVSGEMRKAYLLQLLFLTALLHHEQKLCIVLHMDEKTAYESGALYLPHLVLADGKRGFVCEKREEALQKLLHKINVEETRFCVVFDFYDIAHIGNRMEMDENMTRFQCMFVKETALSAHCAALHLEEKTGVLSNEHKTIPFHYTLTASTHLHTISRMLANQHSMNIHAQSISLHFLDMYHCGCVAELNIYKRWQTGKSMRSLAVCIGRKGNKEPLILDLHEHAHGPHGLVAGMTGSGKSECLLTLILSLCVNYAPNKVSFLLIDYKGGTMASTLQKLPHVAGIISNLETEQLQRAFRSLQSELLLRQQLMSEASMRFDRGNMNIEEYEELCNLHQDLPRLAHLLIIADEFAELKQQQPAFMEQLKQTARIGRSLGIHLLLATQKPAGVIDDQIWSNAHVHLCMKVQTIQDSQDMLKKEDAAHLKNAGECCLQVGYDEVYEQGVIAWSRSPYHQKDVYEEEHFDEVILQQTDGTVIEKRHIKKNMETTQTQMEVLIQEIKRIAKQTNSFATPLWKDALKPILPVHNYQHSVVIIDDIATQRQFPLPFDEEGLRQTFLFGSNDTSITMYLTTFLYVSIQTIKKKICIYVLDFAQHELRLFLQHAYIMDVMTEAEQAKIDSFFHMLKAEVEERKKGKRGISILLILHHYECFHEWYANYEELLQYLLREGTALRIHIYITARSIESIPYRFLQYPHDTLVFWLQDATEYHRIFADVNEVQPMPHDGSGLLLQKGSVCLFQTLLTNSDDIAMLKGWQKWQDDYKIPAMPKYIGHRLQENCLYLGKELISIKDVSIEIKAYSLVYICAALHLFDCTIDLWKKQLQKRENACVLGIDLEYKNRRMPLSCFKDVVEEVDVIIWIKPYACEEIGIQNYLHKQILKDKKTHIFLFTMCEQMEYNRYAWFMAGFYEAMIVWMGKGFQEYRHMFHTSALPQHDVKKNQGLLIEEDTWKTIQLWEVENNG